MSIFFMTLLLQLSLAVSIPPSIRPLTRPSSSQLTLPHPPDPLVLHGTSSSFPPTTIAIKFYSYGARNNLLHVQHLLEFASLGASVAKAYEAIPRNRPLHYPGEDRSMELDFNPGNGVTWGQWIVVLDAMKEFIAWYESRDFLFEVRIFERGKAPRAGGAGILWTGL
ncbi:MAG: hypothetical protein L6R42_007971 [Xanthoria sp. 1 TBL-2021]|nr:MAG: hypothetical protein L6R42_007971 [Xanthoria sp. 1 TBL-2021]